MPNKKPTSQPLAPSQYYHIYNRGNNKGQLFYAEENYTYFLKKCKKYMDGYWEVYAWALMGNHFHLLINVKSKAALATKACSDFKTVNRIFYNQHQLVIHELLEYREEEGATAGAAANLIGLKDLLGLAKLHAPQFYMQILSWAVSERFRRFLMGYAKAINKQENRTGSLFQDRFKSKLIDNKESAKTVLQYIHHNPIHHNMAIYYDQYTWTSYQDYLDRVDYKGLRWYGSLEHFKKEHEAYRIGAIARAVRSEANQKEIEDLSGFS